MLNNIESKDYVKKESYLTRKDSLDLERSLFEKELLSSNIMNDTSKEELSISFLYDYGYLSRDFSFDINGIVVGDSGFGKTRFLESLIGQWAYTTSPDNLKVVLFKTNQFEYTKIDRLPHILGVEYQLDKFENVLDGILDEIEGRKRLLYETGSENMKNYNKNNEDKVPKIVLIIDDLSLILDCISKNKDNYDETSIRKKITDIAMQGRSLGIQSIFSFRGGNEFNAPSNLLNYVSFKVLLTIYDKYMHEKLGVSDYISKLDSSMNVGNNSNNLKFIRGERNAILKNWGSRDCVKVKYISDNSVEDYNNIINYWDEKETKGKFHNIYSHKLEDMFK